MSCRCSSNRVLIVSLLFQATSGRTKVKQLLEPVLHGHWWQPFSGWIPSASSVVLLDATESALVAGPRTSASGHTGGSRWRWRQGWWVRRDRRDAHPGAAVLEAADVRWWRRRWSPQPQSQPQPVDRFQPLAAIVVGRRVCHVRLSHGATGHVPGRVQDAAQGADQDAAHLRHAAAVQRVASILSGRAGRGRMPGETGTIGLGLQRRRHFVVAADHAQVHTQEQEPGHVRLPSGRRPAQQLSPAGPCARRHLPQLITRPAHTPSYTYM